MNTRERHVIREVLGRMGDEAPRPVRFDELDVVELRPQTNPRRRPAVVWTAAAVVVALIGLFAFLTSGPQSPIASTDNGIFFVPTLVPDQLTVSQATMSGTDGFSTNEPNAAIASNLTYLLPGKSNYVEGDQALIISSEDWLAQTEALLTRDELECSQTVDGAEVEVDAETCRQSIEGSQCSGLSAIGTGTLDANQCKAEILTDARFGEGQVEEITVRSHPAVIIEQTRTVSGVDDHSYSVVVFEGGPVVTTVTGHQLDRTTVLRVAEGLQPASATEFMALDNG